MKILILSTEETVHDYLSLCLSLEGHQASFLNPATGRGEIDRTLARLRPDMVIVGRRFEAAQARAIAAAVESFAPRPFLLFWGDMRDPEEILEAYLLGADACLPEEATAADLIRAHRLSRTPGFGANRAGTLHRT